MFKLFRIDQVLVQSRLALNHNVVLRNYSQLSKHNGSIVLERVAILSDLRSKPCERFFSVTFRMLNVQKDSNNHQKSTGSSSIVESKGADQLSTHHRTPGQKAKQAAKDVSYGTIILIGGLTLAAIFYYLFSELFSRENPSGIYDESSKICVDNFEIREALGTPIKVSTDSGGRRVFQIRHKYFIENGQLRLTINYYLEGARNRGTVYCQVKKNEQTGKFEYEHIIVKLDYPHRGQYKIVVKPEKQI